MPAEALIQQTVIALPTFRAARPCRNPARGKRRLGSELLPLRIADEHSLILVKYGDSREENRHYCAIAAFLACIGIHVPEIYLHDEDRAPHLDAGPRRAPTSGPSATSRGRAAASFTRYALDELAALHARAQNAAAACPEIALQSGFNAELYLWEQNYFFENCLGRFFGIAQPACDSAALEQIARTLGGKPCVLVHRDFQSQNILIHRGHARLIDFQGLRAGLAGYDLASLVYDPYVTLTAAEREELVHLYLEGARPRHGNPR